MLEKDNAYKIDLPLFNEYRQHLGRIVATLPGRCLAKVHSKGFDQFCLNPERGGEGREADHQAAARQCASNLERTQAAEGTAGEVCNCHQICVETCVHPQNLWPAADITEQCPYDIDGSSGPRDAARPYCRGHSELVEEFLDASSDTLATFQRILHQVGSFLDKLATEALPAMHACTEACNRCTEHSCMKLRNDGSRNMASTQDPCPICLDEYDMYNPKERINRLNCGHQMHTRCLMQWLLRTNEPDADPLSGWSCPYCRQPTI